MARIVLCGHKRANLGDAIGSVRKVGVSPVDLGLGVAKQREPSLHREGIYRLVCLHGCDR